MRLHAAAACAIAAASSFAAHAGDFTSLNALTQDQFHRLTEDLGAAFSYKGVSPGVPLGSVGLDAGIEVTDTKMNSPEVFGVAGVGNQSRLVIPKLHITKGVFGGFDIAAFAGGAPDIRAGLFGGEMRYAFFGDAIALPAIAVRASGTMATGMGDLRVSTASADLMVSKAVLGVTPYIGGGVTRVEARANNTTLANEKSDQGRVFGGVSFNYLGGNFALELESAGNNTSVSAKIGMRF